MTGASQRAGLRLDYSALSDVGRVRKNNQDSGYAGPWLLSVCDGVGGAARGDIASATAIGQLRRLDTDPGSDDLLGLISGALHRAHDRIAETVEEEPALRGTSTTAVVALFDGTRLALGHIGDSRAYLLREGNLSQLTTDHTFVQSLIDEGRITEEEAESHPHRHLILKALDGATDLEPDLFTVDLAEGDRILVCSDGVSGFLSRDRLAEITGTGSVDYATVELVRASLEAASTDNVTAVVAEVVGPDAELSPDLRPLTVGSAAELPRKSLRGNRPGFFRRHDTGELEPIPDELPPGVDHAILADPIDPEEARYAPREQPRFLWLRRILITMVVLGLGGMLAGAGAWWADRQYYVGEQDGTVTIYRGLQSNLLGYSMSTPYESTNLTLEQLPGVDAEAVREGMSGGSLEDARRVVENLNERADPPTDAPDEGGSDGGR